MRILVLVWIFHWYHRILDNDWKADDALQILEFTSVSIPQSLWTVLPRY